MTHNMTVQDYMSEVMKENSSKFVNKTILLSPKCDSYHWSSYVIFNVNKNMQNINGYCFEPNKHFTASGQFRSLLNIAKAKQ